MLSATAARNIVGIIGNIISFGLFLSPIPTFWKIFKNKGVEEFKPDPYIATVLNCMFWIFYGMPFVHPDSLLVITINSAGLVIKLIYLAVFFFYADTKGRKKVSRWLLAEVIFVAVVALVTMLGFHGTPMRSLVVGIICDIFDIMMYCSPLSLSCVRYMPFPLSMTNFLNGCVWTAYALIKFDIFILISNGIGAISGLVQLVIYTYYYFMGPKEEDNTNGIQLSTAQLGANIV